MNILDLNHIEAVEGSEVLGGGYKSFKQEHEFEFEVETELDLEGWSAVSFGEAEGIGNPKKYYTFSKSDLYAYAAPGYSASGGVVVAAVDRKKKY